MAIALSSVLISLAVSAVMAAASYAYQKYAMKGLKPDERGQGFLLNQTATEAYLPTVYGTATIGIQRVFAMTHPDDKKKLWIVGALCHGEIEAVTYCYLDGERALRFDSAGNIVEFYPNRKGESWEGDIMVWIHKGSDAQTVDLELQGAVGPKSWSDSHKGQGVAYVVLWLHFSFNIFPGGLPNITFKVQGKKVRDPRNTSYPSDTPTFSTNPALCQLDYLTSTRFGISADVATEIDKYSFAAEANYADEKVDIPLDLPGAVSGKVLNHAGDMPIGTFRYKCSYAYYLDRDYGETALGAAVTVTTTATARKVTIASIPSEMVFVYIYRAMQKGDGDYTSYQAVARINTSIQSSYIDNLPNAKLGKSPPVDSDPGSPPAGYTATKKEGPVGNLGVGKYYYRVSFVTAGGETKGGTESLPIKTTSSKKMIVLTDIPISASSLVTSRKIYRTVVNGTEHKLLATIANNTTTTYTDNIADASLGALCLEISTATAGEQKRFELNGIVDNSKEIKANMEELLTANRGNLCYESGKYALYTRKCTAPEMLELTEDNIIGNWKFTLPSAKDMSNIIKASFVQAVDSEKSTAQDNTDFIVWPPKNETNQFLIDDNSFENLKEIHLPYTQNKHTAKQIAQVIRKESRNQIKCTCLAKEEALKLRVGSLVKVTHSTPAWDKKLFWVDGIALGQDGNVQVSLTSYIATDYDYETIELEPNSYPPLMIPDGMTFPDDIQNVVFTEEEYVNRGITFIKLKVTYDEPASSRWKWIDVYVKAGSTNYEYYTRLDKSSTETFYINPVEEGVMYKVKLLAASDYGSHRDIEDTDITEWSHTVSDPGSMGVFTPTDSHVFNETPTGAINGSNVTFTIAFIPMLGSLRLYWNYGRLKETTDYSVSGTTITLTVAPSTGDWLLADYIAS